MYIKIYKKFLSVIDIEFDWKDIGSGDEKKIEGDALRGISF